MLHIISTAWMVIPSGRGCPTVVMKQTMFGALFLATSQFRVSRVDPKKGCSVVVTERLSLFWQRRRLCVILFIAYSMSHHSKKHTFLYKSSNESNSKEIRDDWSWEICCSLRPPSQPLSFGYFIRLIRRWGLKCSFTIAPFATIFRVPGRPSQLP